MNWILITKNSTYLLTMVVLLLRVELLFTDDRFLWPMIWMILELSISLSTSLCIIKDQAPWLVTFLCDAYCCIRILHDLPKLVDSNGCVEEPSLNWKKREKMQISGKKFWKNIKMSLNKDDSCILHSQNIALFFYQFFLRLSYTTIILLIIHFNHSLTNIQSIHYYNHHYYCRLLILLSPTFHHCSQYDKSHSSCTFHQDQGSCHVLRHQYRKGHQVHNGQRVASLETFVESKWAPLSIFCRCPHLLSYSTNI